MNRTNLQITGISLVNKVLNLGNSDGKESYTSFCHLYIFFLWEVGGGGWAVLCS